MSFDYLLRSRPDQDLTDTAVLRIIGDYTPPPEIQDLLAKRTGANTQRAETNRDSDPR